MGLWLRISVQHHFSSKNQIFIHRSHCVMNRVSKQQIKSWSLHVMIPLLNVMSLSCIYIYIYIYYISNNKTLLVNHTPQTRNVNRSNIPPHRSHPKLISVPRLLHSSLYHNSLLSMGTPHNDPFHRPILSFFFQIIHGQDCSHYELFIMYKIWIYSI